MLHRAVRFPRLPVFVAAALCAALAPAHAALAPTPATIVFGSCAQKPVYPEAAKQEKREGIVVLAFQVDADNSVVDSKVKVSSGHADLDEAAREGLAKCKFRAAMHDGTPVREWMELKYLWTLK